MDIIHEKIPYSYPYIHGYIHGYIHIRVSMESPNFWTIKHETQLQLQHTRREEEKEEQEENVRSCDPGWGRVVQVEK